MIKPPTCIKNSASSAVFFPLDGAADLITACREALEVNNEDFDGAMFMSIFDEVAFNVSFYFVVYTFLKKRKVESIKTDGFDVILSCTSSKELNHKQT